MKRLILTRHAKSSWDDPMTPDHDRPLNDRGKAAAADLGSTAARSSGVALDLRLKPGARSPIHWQD